MADPMSDERLAEIRERAESVRTWKAVWSAPVPQLCDVDIPDLLAEVERLRAELAEVSTDHAELIEDLARDIPDDYDGADTAEATVVRWVRDVVADRDRVAKERDALARADQAGERWARQQIERLESSVATLTGQLERVRGLHRGVCVGACGLDDACECEEHDLACDECSASWPCDTIRALDGTEPGS